MKYEYQNIAADKVLENALNPQFLGSILAATPGAGKTYISVKVIAKYLKMFPNNRVLVLTHGQNLLKNQYLRDLKSVAPDFTYGEFGDDVSVQVGLPQSHNKINGPIDLLVTDEAHQFFNASLVKRIIYTLKPKHRILLTGSPSTFIKHNETYPKKYGIYFISAEELQEQDVFSNLYLNLSRTTDINQILINAVNEGCRIDKVMIACKTIDQANKIAKEIVGRKVVVSESASDKDGDGVDSFRKGLADTLIVVGRGILGLNDGEITTLIDYRASNELDNSFQLCARILRKHPREDIRKAYFRVTSPKTLGEDSQMLYKIASFMTRDTFTRYNRDDNWTMVG